jgi:hypothetical protein
MGEGQNVATDRAEEDAYLSLPKKSFDGCDGRITNFPIANASAEAVHRTSEVDGFTKICDKNG